MKNIQFNIKLLAAFFLIIASSVELSAQGCVAIRTVGGLNTMEHSMMHGTMNGMLNDSNAQKMNTTVKVYADDKLIKTEVFSSSYGSSSTFTLPIVLGN